MGIWTPPLTWDTGRLVTAADLNTQIRDNLLYLKNLPAQIVFGQTFTTSSTSWVPVHETQNIITRPGGRMLCVAYGHVYPASAMGAQRFFLNYEIDGAMITGSNEGIQNGTIQGTAFQAMTFSIVHLTNVLSAAMHTFRLYARVTGGPLNIWMGQAWMREV